MEALTLLDIIGNGENSRVQFKKIVKSSDDIAKEMVAMSNSIGGMIVVGVEDKTGQIIGLNYEEIKRSNDFLANASTNNVKPPIYILTEIIIIEDKKVLIAHINEGSNKPYCDNNGIVWIKSGSDKRRVTDNIEYARLLQSSGLISADEMIVAKTSLDDFDLERFKKFFETNYEQTIEDTSLSLTQLLHNLNLIKDQHLNLAGLLLFGKEPQRYKPTFLIRAVSFFGNDIEGQDYRDSRDIIGDLEMLYDQGMKFLLNNLHYTQQGRNFNTLGILEISRVALEEILQNALIHRDYFKNAPIRILILDNRIEIISPGKLPNNLTVENIKYGNVVIRNNLIASFATKMLPYRGLGTGIKRAIKEQPDIEFINDISGEQFISVIPRPAKN
jgi:ATP-dependent DNA helicase RecG